MIHSSFTADLCLDNDYGKAASGFGRIFGRVLVKETSKESIDRHTGCYYTLNVENSFNPLPDDIILDRSKLKQIADDI